MQKSISILTVFVLIIGIAFLVPADSKAEGDAAKGGEVYKTYCATCHGDTGKGDGIAAAALDPKPRDLSNADYVSGLTDAHIKKVVTEGGAAAGMSATMPAWGEIIPEADINNIIAYIRADVCKCTAK
jgi:mono/diheme cytochrome c family protein